MTQEWETSWCKVLSVPGPQVHVYVYVGIQDKNMVNVLWSKEYKKFKILGQKTM